MAPASSESGGGDGEITTTVLEKHAAFFDRNNDGLIYPWETFQGMRAIGCGIFISTAAAILVNLGLSAKTRPGKIFPNLLFPIEIKNIARARHGSDTHTYDTKGRFVPEKFEAIFQKYAKTNPNGLTSDELSQMLNANKEPRDFVGQFSATTEWKVLYMLCKDKDGLLPKEKIRGVYDGTMFHQLEKDRLADKQERKAKHL